MAWFVHTSEWINYTLNMRFENDCINHSFSVWNNNQIMAVVPLIEETIFGTKKRRLGFSGFNCPYPAISINLGERLRKKVEKFIFKTILQIGKIDEIVFYLCPLLDPVICGRINTNPLLKHTFHDTTITTNIIDLNQKTDEDIYRNFRKGHKADIKYASTQNYSIEIIDKSNLNDMKFDQYRYIHKEAAGRQTRPQSTWEIMHNWVIKGYSILALLKKQDLYISVAFVNIYKQKAYYQSGATLPILKKERGIGHILQWEIIKYLNNNHYSHYEIGWNWYLNISQEVADAKMHGISRFKTGFGSQVYPLFRGELFFSERYMKNVFNDRIRQYFDIMKSMSKVGKG